MPKKKETEIQFARLLSNTPLQIELTLMTTASYQPQNTPADYLLQFYRRLPDVRDEFFDGLIVTGAPVETIDFEKPFKQIVGMGSNAKSFKFLESCSW